MKIDVVVWILFFFFKIAIPSNYQGLFFNDIFPILDNMVLDNYIKLAHGAWGIALTIVLSN